MKNIPQLDVARASWRDAVISSRQHTKAIRAHFGALSTAGDLRILRAECARFFGIPEMSLGRSCNETTAPNGLYLPIASALASNRKLRRLVSRTWKDTAREWHSSISSRINSRQLDRSAPAKTLTERIRERPLTPKAWKYDRAVGVEIETVSPVDQVEALKSVPLYCQVSGDGSIASRDGSRPYGVEFKLLLKRADLELRLWRTLEALKRIGVGVNSSCGLHVHFDMRGKSLPEVKRLGAKLTGWLKVLSELVPASRRENSYCKLVSSTTDRYCAVNLTAFQKYETLEVRLHSATTDYTKVLSWIRLCELCMASKAAHRCENTLQALASLPLPEHERAYWLNRHRQLNPGAYASAAITSTEVE